MPKETKPQTATNGDGAMTLDRAGLRNALSAEVKAHGEACTHEIEAACKKHGMAIIAKPFITADGRVDATWGLVPTE